MLIYRRLPIASERALQDEIQSILFGCGIQFVREARLGQDGVVDFLTSSGIAIETKIKGAKMQIYRQCERYCSADQVRGLVLASSVYMNLPDIIKGKPARVANLARAWL